MSLQKNAESVHFAVEVQQPLLHLFANRQIFAGMLGLPVACTFHIRPVKFTIKHISSNIQPPLLFRDG